MPQKVRVLQLDTDERVETGAVQFNMKDGYEDWPGLFIRGDNAAWLAFQLNQALETLEEIDKKNPEQMLGFNVIGELKGIRDMIWGDVIVGGWPPKKDEGQVVS
jgi:hypothetical protein